MKYSCLIISKKNDCLGKIEALLQDGIKVILFGNNEDKNKLVQLAKQYKYFIYYILDLSTFDEAYIEDGKLTTNDEESLKRLSKRVPEFNLEQFMVEHAEISKTIIVKASAGTGKTTVMVDRIMYLLATVPDLEPKEICMITFTNKAAQSMRERLYNKIMDYYTGSRNFKYLELLEKITEIQISTIDSFFYNLIRKNGVVLGYGENAKIRSFIYEKKEIIKEVINNRFKDYAGDFLDKSICTINEYVDSCLECWDFLNKRGYYYDDIKKFDFGEKCDWKEEEFSTSLKAGIKSSIKKAEKAGKRNSVGNSEYIAQAKYISGNMKSIILEADKLYRRRKKFLNSTSMQDITSDMTDIIKNTDETRSEIFKFMFVDEFQDTDDSQIKSLAWLKKVMSCQLFVVGDVKQSIYRFRGAEETAFDKLELLLPQGNCSTKILIKNYRTQNNILSQFNTIFKRWSDQDLLPWDGDLVSPLNKPGEFRSMEVDRYSEIEGCYIGLLEKHLQLGEDICTLVRTNFNAKELAGICRAHKIPCLTSMTGGFYGSKPVLDLFHCIAVVLFPKENTRLFNFLLTPYSIVKPDLTKITAFEGDEDKINRYLSKLAEENNLELLVKKSKNIPVFQLLRELIEEYDPVSNYAVQCRMELEKDEFSEEKLRTQLEYNKRSYLINLDKLVGIMGDAFSSEYVSLLDVYDFLLHKITSDTEEDMLYPELDEELDKKIVKIMTVHKAKGLEYDTVIMPYTNKRFYADISERGTKHEFITCGEENDKLGWRMALVDKMDRCNKNYDENKESEYAAITREELRVLYVAMTRAKKKLIYIYLKNYRESSWAGYLRD